MYEKIKVLFYVIILVLIIFLFVYYSKLLHPNIWSRAYGKKTDKTEELLNRIEWANNYKSSLKIPIRNLLISLVISFFVVSVVENSLPMISNYIKTVFIIFVFLQAFYNFCQFHCEKFPHFSIKKNIDMIRRQNGYKKALPTRFSPKFNNFTGCRTYVYKTQIF